MIPAEPGIRPRAVHVLGDRLMSLQAIFDANSFAVVGASRPGTVLSMPTAQRRASGNRIGLVSARGGAAILPADQRVSDRCGIGTGVWRYCYWLPAYLTAQYCDVYSWRLGRCIRLR